MRAVYRSIKPYWLYLILIGKKTIEVGKTFPKAEDWNKEVFLNCSKDMKSFKRIPEKDREWMLKYLGKVACRFVCKRIDPIEKRGINNNFDYCYQSLNVFGNDDIEVEITDIKNSCISKPELNAYGASSWRLFAWHISDLVIYDKPKKINDFVSASILNTNCFGQRLKRLERPPQSWCYVEEVSR